MRSAADSPLALRFTLLAAVCAVIGCGAQKRSGPYTAANIDHSSCGSGSLHKGAPLEVVLKLRNDSGQRWRSTILLMQGLESLRLDSITANRRPATDLGNGYYNLGPLAADARTSVQLRLSAVAAGRRQGKLEVWGEDNPFPAVATIILPDKVVALTCNYAIA